MSESDLFHLISPEAQQFYRDHTTAHIPNLLLKFGRDPQKKMWVEQLDARNRAKKKLPTWYKNQNVVFPPKRNLEQASSESTARYKATLFSYNTSADLTAGTGVDSWAFAQCSTRHIAIEPSPELTSIISHNFSVLGTLNSKIFTTHAAEFLAETNTTVDLVYLDPSRRADSGRKVIQLEDYSPNVIELKDRLLSFAETVMIKVSPMVDLHYLKDVFKYHLATIHIVAVQNEVKEILVVLHRNSHDFSVKTIDLRNNENIEAEFNISQDHPNFEQANSVKNYLYEPNAAVLKSGYFNALCAKYGVQKIDRHSHLYTSQELISTFPGFAYTVKEVGAPFKLKTPIERASIISRNFPQKPESIKKRLKLKEGDDLRIFATTFNGKKVFILGEPVRNK